MALKIKGASPTGNNERRSGVPESGEMALSGAGESLVGLHKGFALILSKRKPVNNSKEKSDIVRFP